MCVKELRMEEEKDVKMCFWHTFLSRRCELSEVMPEGACIQITLPMEMFL